MDTHAVRSKKKLFAEIYVHRTVEEDRPEFHTTSPSQVRLLFGICECLHFSANLPLAHAQTQLRNCAKLHLPTSAY